MRAATGSPVSACRNCGQPVQATASACLWCGVATSAQPPAPPAPTTPQRGPTSPLPLTPPAPAGLQSGAGVRAQPQTSVAASVRSARRARSATLGPAFRGSAAPTGAQIAAFTIDTTAVTTVVVAVHLLVGSAVITAIALIEMLVLLWVLEARAGITVGNLALRIRTARADRPFSPGAARSLGRGVLTGLSLLLLVVGAWVAAASAAWDGTGRRRSLIARATGTQPVAIMARTTQTSTTTVASPPAPASTPTAPGPYAPLTHAPPPTGAAAVQHVEATPVHAVTAMPVERTADRVITAAPGTSAQPTPGASDLAAVPDLPVAADPSLPVPAPPSAGALLLVFDTGQRDTLSVPTVANIGRRPDPSEEGDQLVAVGDDQGTVSKTHLRLEHARGRTWVTDLHSTNGTDLLDDDGPRPLAPGQRTELDDGVRVRIGKRTFTVSALMDSSTRAERRA